MTSNKNRRDLKRIDYKIFNETGKRVEKIMVDSVELLLEAKLAADIDEFLLFDINEIFSAYEISECLQTAILYSKEYRDVHTELRLKMGDDYKNDYPIIMWQKI